jgi:hypothetical protein
MSEEIPSYLFEVFWGQYRKYTAFFWKAEGKFPLGVAIRVWEDIVKIDSTIAGLEGGALWLSVLVSYRLLWKENERLGCYKMQGIC